MRGLHNLFLKFLVSIEVDEVVVLYAFVSACDIAFSMSLPVFSCAVLHAHVIFIISPDTLSVKLS